MKSFLILLLILLLSYSSANAQKYRNIKISENEGEIHGPCEPSIAINPKNTRNIVVGAILDKVYYSENSGKTWKYLKLKSPYGVWGDPCVIADSKGSFYYLHLSDPTGFNWLSDEVLDRIVCQKSKNGGKTWSKGTFMGLNGKKDQDKEWAVVDPKTENIYVTWTQFDIYNSQNSKDSSNVLFAKSTDSGKTWSKAVRINQFSGDCLDDDQTVEGAIPTVGPQGEVYVTWAWKDKIYFDKSLDEGKTWQRKDNIVTNLESGWAMDIPGIGRSNGLPVIGCDISDSAYKGTIYVNWSDQSKETGDTDIWLTKSINQGKTWTEPMRVNNDDSGKHQFFNWMAVDPITGYIYIIFYDRRNYTDNRTDVYLAYSKDGGETFVNEKISESPFIPNPQVFFGDYNNVSAYNGIVRPVWTRSEGIRLSIWTALIDIK